MNKIILGGVFGRAPEVRYLPNGDVACHFSLATKKRSKDPTTGEWDDRTDWHPCVAYRKLGETIAKYFNKGSGIVVWGELNRRKWTDKDGVVHNIAEVEVESFDFPPGPRPGGANSSKPAHDSQESGSSGGAATSVPNSEQNSSFTLADEDPLF
jgi:single-strand DNA-binding protein